MLIMPDEPVDLAKAIILELANKEFQIDPEQWISSYNFHEALKEKLTEYGYDTAEKTSGLLKHMAEMGQLQVIDNDYYIISAKGVEDLSTIYDDDWMNLEINSALRESREKKLKEKEGYELVERRHQDLVKAAREGNKFQKYGVWIAIALGSVGLITAIFKP